MGSPLVDFNVRATVIWLDPQLGWVFIFGPSHIEILILVTHV